MAIIGSIRKKSGLAVAVVAIAIVAFILGDLSKKGQRAPNEIAKVNDRDITFGEFNFNVEQAENNMKQQYQTGSLTNEQSFQVKQQVFNQLLQEKLLESQCEKLGLMVGEEEMNDLFFGDFIHPMVRQQITDPKTGQMNVQALKQQVAQFDKLPQEQQISWKNFENYVKSSTLQQKYEKLLSSGLYMPKTIAKHIAEVSNKTIDSRYVVLPFASVDDKDIKITDEDYKKYYEEHIKEFEINETFREVNFVKFAVVPTPADIQAIADSVAKIYTDFQATDAKDLPSFVSLNSENRYDSAYYKKDDLKTYFPDSILANKGIGSFIEPRQVGSSWVMGKVTNIQSRPDSVRFSMIAILNDKISKEIPRTQEQADALIDSIVRASKASPAMFESFVQNSDDQSTKENMGDVGWVIDNGGMNALIFDSLRLLPKNSVFAVNANVMNPNFPDSAGMIIIKLTDKSEAVSKMQMATITVDIRATDKTINATKDKADVFLGSVKTMDEFTAAAQKQNVNILTANVRDMDYQLNGTPYCREIIKWIFNDKTKKGDIAAEVYQLSDMFLVVGVKDIWDKGTLPLEKIKTQLEQQVKLDKKAEQLMEKATKLLASNKTIEAVASAATATIDSVSGTSFSDPYFAQAGPEMRIIGTLSSATKTGLQKPIKGFNGIYIVNVDNIGKKPMAEDANVIQQQYNMRSSQKTSQLRMPLTILQNKAEIKNNFSFFN
ncbi:MAG: SurA N-terminal domain-containing protein [Bacteroidales bacterium]|jgi:peptidyl-prolyl cis-trans isomerase D|nr:SurA N-terminal domain-containing protein [Bacteroidales bacterium]